jgi:hypothetical protein
VPVVPLDIPCPTPSGAVREPSVSTEARASGDLSSEKLARPATLAVPVRVRFTDYAKGKMALRKITEAEARQAIYSPVFTRPDHAHEDRTIFTGRQGTRKVEVVAEQIQGEWVVITAWD